MLLAKVEPKRARHCPHSHLHGVAVMHKFRSDKRAGHLDNESLLISARRYRQVSGWPRRLAEEVDLPNVDEVVPSCADEVLVHFGDHAAGALRQPLRYPDAGAEAAVALLVGRRERDHENIERAVVPGRNFVCAPAADWQVVDLARLHHFTVQWRGVVIADGEPVLFTGPQPREQSRRMFHFYTIQVAPTCMQRFTKRKRRAGEGCDAHTVP